MIKKLFLQTIKFYQNFISPALGRNCRFYPSCSQYSRLAIEKYGAKRGLRQGLKRILRCHPWSRGGEDLP